MVETDIVVEVLVVKLSMIVVVSTVLSTTVFDVVVLLLKVVGLLDEA